MGTQDQIRAGDNHKQENRDCIKPIFSHRWFNAGRGEKLLQLFKGFPVFLSSGWLYTSQICTPCRSEAILSSRLGMNSCAMKPLKPVATIAFTTAG